jgi:hypothetical protein
MPRLSEAGAAHEPTAPVECLRRGSAPLAAGAEPQGNAGCAHDSVAATQRVFPGAHIVVALNPELERKERQEERGDDPAEEPHNPRW